MSDNTEYGQVIEQNAQRNKQKPRYLKKDQFFEQNYPPENDYNPEMISQISPAGHIYEEDYTKDKERIKLTHPMGTGFEILADGAMLNNVQGTLWSYHKSGGTITFDRDIDMKYNGHYRQNVSGGSHMEFKGDRTSFTAGSAHEFTAGNLGITSKSTMTIAADKSITLGGHGADKGQSPVRISLGTDGAVYITSASNMHLISGGDINMIASKIKMTALEIHNDTFKNILAKGGFVDIPAPAVIRWELPPKGPEPSGADTLQKPEGADAGNEPAATVASENVKIDDAT